MTTVKDPMFFNRMLSFEPRIQHFTSRLIVYQFIICQKLAGHVIVIFPIVLCQNVASCYLTMRLPSNPHDLKHDNNDDGDSGNSMASTTVNEQTRGACDQLLQLLQHMDNDWFSLFEDGSLLVFPKKIVESKAH